MGYFGWKESSQTWGDAMSKARALAAEQQRTGAWPHLKPAVKKSREHFSWAWMTGWVRRQP